MTKPTDSRRPAHPGRLAVVYARVSSKEQEREGFSIPAQLRLLRDYAVSNGLTVAREFIDVETAKHTGRPAFGEMLVHLRSHREIRVILAEKTDRLYRNLKDWVVIDDLDLEVHVVKEGSVLSSRSRSSDKFMHGIRVLMAKNYIDNLAEETRKGQLEKAEQGIWPSFAPLGYRNVLRSDGKKAIEPDPRLAPLVTMMFERFAQDDISIKDLALTMGREGLCFRKSRVGVNTATVHRMLRQRIYSGDFDWCGAVYRGVHTPLVSGVLWQRVQHILDERNAKRPKAGRHRFAFQGLVRCGHCSCSMVAERHKGRYVYYRCTGFRGRCPERYTREETLRQQIAEYLAELRVDDEVLSWIVDDLRTGGQEARGQLDRDIAELQREIDRLQERIDTMYMDRLEGRVSVEFFDRKSGAWRQEQDRLRAGIEHWRQSRPGDIEVGITALERAAQAGLEFESLPEFESGQLAAKVLSNCSWIDARLKAEYRPPFDSILEGAQQIRALGHRDQIAIHRKGRSENWSGARDSNPGPLGPEPSALPDCASPRRPGNCTGPISFRVCRGADAAWAAQPEAVTS